MMVQCIHCRHWFDNNGRQQCLCRLPEALAIQYKAMTKEMALNLYRQAYRHAEEVYGGMGQVFNVENVKAQLLDGFAIWLINDVAEEIKKLEV